MRLRCREQKIGELYKSFFTTAFKPMTTVSVPSLKSSDHFLACGKKQPPFGGLFAIDGFAGAQPILRAAPGGFHWP